jgi:hypothetical protein
MGISQKCPKCRSSRIRKGYKPTPFLLRLVGLRHLLCNDCNLLFTGFSVGTIGSGKKSRTKTSSPTNSSPNHVPEEVITKK